MTALALLISGAVVLVASTATFSPRVAGVLAGVLLMVAGADLGRPGKPSDR